MSRPGNAGDLEDAYRHARQELALLQLLAEASAGREKVSVSNPLESDAWWAAEAILSEARVTLQRLATAAGEEDGDAR